MINKKYDLWEFIPVNPNGSIFKVLTETQANSGQNLKKKVQSLPESQKELIMIQQHEAHYFTRYDYEIEEWGNSSYNIIFKSLIFDKYELIHDDIGKKDENKIKILQYGKWQTLELTGPNTFMLGEINYNSSGQRIRSSSIQPFNHKRSL